MGRGQESPGTAPSRSGTGPGLGCQGQQRTRRVQAGTQPLSCASVPPDRGVGLTTDGPMPCGRPLVTGAASRRGSVSWACRLWDGGLLPLWPKAPEGKQLSPCPQPRTAHPIPFVFLSHVGICAPRTLLNVNGTSDPTGIALLRPSPHVLYPLRPLGGHMPALPTGQEAGRLTWASARDLDV